jgi:hypothetical protein
MEISEELVVAQVCADRLSAEITANLLRAGAVPAQVRSFAPIPGLDQGAEVLVPASYRRRAQWLMEQARPTDAELNDLATGQSSPADDQGRS